MNRNNIYNVKHCNKVCEGVYSSGECVQILDKNYCFCIDQEPDINSTDEIDLIKNINNTWLFVKENLTGNEYFLN